MLDKNYKLSIIIPMYNVKKYIDKCLKSLLNQSYKNLEIIVVDDCSTDDGYKIVQKYMTKDNRIKYVKHEKNKGLFQARITGSREATGEYIAFLDSDDYVSIDYYRTLIYNAVENSSDIVIGNTVLEYDDGRRTCYNLFDFKFDELNGENCLEEYFRQEGLCFSWHTIWNKIYSKEIWDKAFPHYSDITSHLIMTEDFAFSTVLFYYAKKITKVENDAIFYCKHEQTSTDVNKLNIKKFRKNINDLKLSFGFVQNFLKKMGIYDKYGTNFERWRALYKGQQVSYLKWSNLEKNDEREANELINEFCDSTEEIKDGEYFYSIQTEWNSRLEEIKNKIADPKVQVISFDIFDTLILRPFWIPRDMFLLLDSYFREISKNDTGINFSKIRVMCEQIAREEICNSKCQEVTLDEIYKTINEKYMISMDILEKMKQKEIEYELRFCTRRNTGYELYQMAKEMGKQVVCISDMYLDKEVIRKILQNNNYNIEKIFISSEYRLTKSTGDLYTKAFNELGVSQNKILHIGDNYYSDVEMAKKKGLHSDHLQKAADAFIEKRLADVFIRDLPDWQDNIASMNFLGIRTMMGIVANKYFDNPYRPFNDKSIFNADTYLIGYYALGMHLYGIANWLIKDVTKKNYDNVVFMARDGYLPLKAYELLKKVYKNSPKEKYLYVSRKALIPASITSRIDLYKLSEVINVEKYTPRKVLKYITGSIDIAKDAEVILKSNNIKMDKRFKNIVEFNKFMSVVDRDLFDEEKNNNTLEKIKMYFYEFFKGKSCTFDVGYSARPEMYISKLLNIKLDTYFININHEEAYEHARIGGFELNTFFDYKPTFTGNVRELVLSNTMPSCIGYNTESEKAFPIFEESIYEYKEIYTINSMQKAALDFIRDLISVFGNDIERMNYQDYYISLPHEMYLQSPTDIDKKVLSCIYFEDDLRADGHINVVDFWNDEIKNHNQHGVNELIDFSNYSRDSGKTYDEKIEEAKFLLLEKRSRPIKLIYYVFFDRVTLKRRFREIFGKSKIIMIGAKVPYKCARKIKRIIKK